MPVAERVVLGDRVAQLRKQQRLTQRELADRVGVTPQTISNWERSVVEVPSAEISTVAEALGTDVAGLFNPPPGGGQVVPDFFNVPPLEDQRAAGIKPLPIYRWGSLGDPRDRDSSPHPDREEYPPAGREYLIGPNGFGVDVRGTSMVARDLHDGDVCWVNPDRPYRVGDLVLALVTNGDGDSGMVVKTYARTEVGVCLVSESDDGKSPVACREFRVIGPVVGVQRWFPPR